MGVDGGHKSVGEARRVVNMGQGVAPEGYSRNRHRFHHGTGDHQGGLVGAVDRHSSRDHGVPS